MKAEISDSYNNVHNRSPLQKYNEYTLLCQQRDEGNILTPDGLHFICEANGYDPEKIGKHFLEVLPRVYQRPTIPEETE